MRGVSGCRSGCDRGCERDRRRRLSSQRDGGRLRDGRRLRDRGSVGRCRRLRGRRDGRW